eukprot:CAMPEP_0202727042 /NCGR_PEP_ID=MMETSP1385-20130828/184919_1 /ASSEMBLY_ACC=CAM_ASM_000861 /TAXON_ID=933848 /ORGANISM="Elphidium margaritaceum" /LENGTH=575 /DNA_ID=CAMNT_0049393275 /DNA_START=48 /DNA_END=1777 /DNA_ORIENTATION=+
MSTSKRATRHKKPNAALYVGYVEDEETPEMIMKKFAEMEKMYAVAAEAKAKQQHASGGAKNSKAEMSDDDEDEAIEHKKEEDAPFTEEQLVSLFNDTSYYSIQSLKSNNDIMRQVQTVDEEGFVVDIENPDFEKLMFEVDYDVTGTDIVNWMDEDNHDAGDFWDEEEQRSDQDDDDEEVSKKRSRRSTTSDGSRRPRRSTKSSGDKEDRFARFQGHNIAAKQLNDIGNTLNAKKRARAREAACHELETIKVPRYPIPISWAKRVKAYDGRTPEQLIGSYYEEKDILSMLRRKDFFYASNTIGKYRAILMDPPFDVGESVTGIGENRLEKDILSMLRRKDFFYASNTIGKYRAILMDPPFDVGESVTGIGENRLSYTIKLAEFAKLPIGELIPGDFGGMLFIWVPSELLSQINDILEAWGFILVEHATWVQRNLSYKIYNRDCGILGVGKGNLLLYRKTKKANTTLYTKIQLRHQRTSDSYFDFARHFIPAATSTYDDSYFDFVRRHPETHRELKPDYHYTVIETLLPDLDQYNNGAALYLWAPRYERRSGWTCIADSKQIETLMNVKEDIDIGDW